MTVPDRSGPGVRITVLANERAPSGEPLNLDGRILGFTDEAAERKARPGLHAVVLKRGERLAEVGGP